MLVNGKSALLCHTCHQKGGTVDAGMCRDAATESACMPTTTPVGHPQMRSHSAAALQPPALPDNAPQQRRPHWRPACRVVTGWG